MENNTTQAPQTTPTQETQTQAPQTPTQPVVDPKAPQVSVDGLKPPEAPNAEQQQQKEIFLKWTQERKHVEAERKAFKEERTQYEQERKTYQEQLDRMKQIEILAKENPVELLKLLGTDYKSLTDKVIQNLTMTPDQKKMSELEEKLNLIEEEKKREQLQQAEKQFETRVSFWKDQIKDYISKDPNTYELTHHTKSYDLVFDVMKQHFIDTKTALPIDVAAKHVESYLEEIKSKEVEELLKANKLKSKFIKTETITTPELDATKKPRPTLSFSDNQTRLPDPPTGKISKEESLKRAFAKAKALSESQRR